MRTPGTNVETIDTSPLLWELEYERDHDGEIIVVHDSNNSKVPSANSDNSEAKVRSSGSFFSELADIFSWRFLSWLAIDQSCISGGAYALVQAVALPLFKGLGIDASRQQLYTSMMLSPWAMKPFIGVASDLFTIQGYNKRYFALNSILVGLIGSLLLLGIYHSGLVESAIQQGSSTVEHIADMIVMCFSAMSFQASTMDILGEGKYAELMNLHPQSGSSLIIFKYGCRLLGTIITQSYVGVLSDAGYFNVLIWIGLALSLTPFYPTLFGWLPEKVRTEDEPGLVRLCSGCLFDRGALEERRAPFIMITLCGLSAPLLAAVTTYANLAIGLIFAAVLIVAFVVSTFHIFPRTFSRVFLSMTLQSLSTLSISSALQYYYTASKECVPDGPNFDYTYYITVTGVVGSIVNFIAVFLYQSFMSGWRFRHVLILMKVTCCLASMIDLIIFMRWNIAIGIPDKIFFLFGNAIFDNLVTIMLAIPMSSINAKIAPPGMESAVFAYTVGSYSFCSMFNTMLGSGVIRWSGMKTIGDNCNFESLPYLIVIFQIFVPLVVGIPAIFMLPNVLQTEHIIDWEKEDWYANGANDSAKLVKNKGEDMEEEVEKDPRLEPQYLL